MKRLVGPVRDACWPPSACGMRDARDPDRATSPATTACPPRTPSSRRPACAFTTPTKASAAAARSSSCTALPRPCMPGVRGSIAWADDYRIVAIDLPGHGLTQTPAGYRATLEGNAAAGRGARRRISASSASSSPAIRWAAPCRLPMRWNIPSGCRAWSWSIAAGWPGDSERRPARRFGAAQQRCRPLPPEAVRSAHRRRRRSEVRLSSMKRSSPTPSSIAMPISPWAKDIAMCC